MLETFSNPLDYVFSSLDTDTIKKEKTLKIYYKDIKEIINRRFLHMWQGNEIFLKNGKSYYFNFYKIEINQLFFREIRDKCKFYNIDLIENCKKEFKNKNYTKVNIYNTEMVRRKNY